MHMQRRGNGGGKGSGGQGKGHGSPHNAPSTPKPTDTRRDVEEVRKPPLERPPDRTLSGQSIGKRSMGVRVVPHPYGRNPRPLAWGTRTRLAPLVFAAWYSLMTVPPPILTTHDSPTTLPRQEPNPRSRDRTEPGTPKTPSGQARGVSEQFMVADNDAERALNAMPPPPARLPTQQPANIKVSMGAGHAGLPEAHHQDMQVEQEPPAQELQAQPTTQQQSSVPDGMLRFSTKDEVLIDNYEICQAYMMTAMQMDASLNMPLMEDGGGMHGRRNGPWTMHMQIAQAKAFADLSPTVQIEKEGGGHHVLTVSALKIMEDERQQPSSFATGPTITSLLKESGGYLVVKLDAGRQFVHTHSADVRTVLSSMGVKVFSCSRGQVKMPDEAGSTDTKNWVPLGTGMITQYITASVKPTGVPLDEFSWPPALEVETKSGFNFQLRYRLGGNRAANMCAEYDGCKKKIMDCICPSKDDRNLRKQGKRPAEAARDRQAKAQKGANLFYSSLPKSDRPCAHLAKGLCKAGSRCMFMHNGPPSSWETIKCELPKSRQTAVCAAAPYCVYAECAERQRQYQRDQRFGGGSSESCMADPFCMQP